MRKILLSIFFLILFYQAVSAQNKDIQIGTPFNKYQSYQGAFYDYSEPESINKKVAVWGFVKYPGKYVVPGESDVMDLLSYAGGPTDYAEMENFRLFRLNSDSSYYVFNIDWNALLWEDSVKNITTKLPELKPGDILMVPGDQRLYFKDWLSISLSIFSAMVSLAILILRF